MSGWGNTKKLFRSVKPSFSANLINYQFTYFSPFLTQPKGNLWGLIGGGLGNPKKEAREGRKTGTPTVIAQCSEFLSCPADALLSLPFFGFLDGFFRLFFFFRLGCRQFSGRVLFWMKAQGGIDRKMIGTDMGKPAHIDKFKMA
jgi:hypothetical protein